MAKTYVIDTNVLIQAPYALYCFEDNHLVLPFAVLEELDGLKKAEGEKGANAREVIRTLEKLRLSGDLIRGVNLEGGGTLRVESNFVHVELPDSLPKDTADNRILKVCKGLYEQSPGDCISVVLVTKDILLRMKAQLIGIESEDFISEQVRPGEEQYLGRSQCYVGEAEFLEFKKNGVSRYVVYKTDSSGNRISADLTENEFVILQSDQSLKKTQLGRVEGDRIMPLSSLRQKPYGVVPRNAGQYFMQEALMMPADKAPLVIIKGMAGTAKTFYSLAVGLEKLISCTEKEYRRMVISRPNAQFDSDIGFLPGDEQEKISPLMRPIIDNLELLIDSSEEERYKSELELKDKITELFDRGMIVAEAMNYIRGRSFVKTYLIIDEAQNMTPNQIKGIITRAGQGTKIVILGDPNQIDKPFLDDRTNGLSYASEHMKGSSLCYQITLTTEECERSKLAMDAIKRL